MRLPWARQRHIPTWTAGIIEDAEPDMSVGDRGTSLGRLSSGENFVATPGGKLAVRGGTPVRKTFTDGAADPIELMLLIARFTPTGAIVFGWSLEPKHYAWRMTPEMNFFTGVEATSRIDLTAGASSAWDSTPAARPVAAELFEKLFVCDAARTYGARQTLLGINGAGVVQELAFDFNGGSESLRPYCVEEFKNVLFIAGYDSKTAPNAPEMVRHSFLGRDPAAANGFDKEAYNRIGAIGQRVTAMKKGKDALLIAKDTEVYRLTGAGRGREGWQYAVELVTQSEELGVANPLALEFHDPYWYGVGKNGPFICNGVTIDSLVPARRKSWPAITNVDKCFVVKHPERGGIVFGFNRPPDVKSNYPNRFWFWDTARECWQPDWKYPNAFVYARSLGTALASGPVAPPGVPAVDHTAATLSSIRYTFTPGDPLASTEAWLRPLNGSEFRHSATAPGAGPFTIDLTGLDPSTLYELRLRHERDGIYSDYTPEFEAYTVLAAPPAPVAEPMNDGRRVTVTAFSTIPDVTIEAYRDDLTLIGSVAIGGVGSAVIDDLTVPCVETHTYKTKHFNSFWPVVIQRSDYSPDSNPAESCTG